MLQHITHNASSTLVCGILKQWPWNMIYGMPKKVTIYANVFYLFLIEHLFQGPKNI